MTKKVSKTPAEAALLSLVKNVKEKIQRGEHCTAAEIDLLERSAKSTAGAKTARPGKPKATACPETTLNEDLEEWVVRDGIVRGRVTTLRDLVAAHKVRAKGRGKTKLEPLAVVEADLLKKQRQLLKAYGFDIGRRGATLDGAERQALQFVISMQQLARASQEWELQLIDTRRRRDRGDPVDLEEFRAIVSTVRQLCEKRDGLIVKLRDLALKEKRASSGGRGRRNGDAPFMIEVTDGLEG